MIERNTPVGPVERRRPGTSLRRGDRVGNFVEVQHTELGADSKANNPTY